MTRALLQNKLSTQPAQDWIAPLLQYHPLGFFCIRWNFGNSESVRIHIWNREFDWTQEPNWPIHDHIFSFKSVVLHGLIQNKIYTTEFNPKTHRNWTVYEVSYDDQESALRPISNQIGLKVASHFCQRALSTYELAASTFHRSKLRSKIAVTVLATKIAPNASQKPRVVGADHFASIKFNRRPNDNTRALELINDAVSWLT